MVKPITVVFDRMNVFMYELATDSIAEAPEVTPDKLVIEDNVGEGIHIHIRNLRLEMSIDDFETFADHLTVARDRINDGNR